MNALTLLQFTTDFNMASEETTNVINNWHTITDIFVASIIPILIACIKGLSDFFKPENKLPKSLYFTQSYDSRLKRRKRYTKEIALVILLMYSFIIAVDCVLGFSFNHEIITEISFCIVYLLLIPILFFYIKCIRLSGYKKRCHIGNNAKLIKTGKIAFLLILIASAEFAYGESYVMIFDYNFYHKMTDKKLKEILTYYPERLEEMIEKSRMQLVTTVVLVALLGIVAYAVAAYFYLICVDAYTKDEAIALGYTMVNKKPAFIHYLEGDNYICSNYAYYNERGSVILHEKKWIADKNIYLLAPSLRNQIIDLYNYQMEALRFTTLSGDVARLVDKGQYKLLTEEEADKLNKWLEGASHDSNSNDDAESNSDNNDAA